MNNLKVEYVDVSVLIGSDYNPRKWSDKQKQELTESIQKFGTIDPILVNSNPERFNIVIGGHFRLQISKELKHNTVPVIYLNLCLEKERELNIRLNKNHGEFDLELLKDFDLDLLNNIGFNTEELSDLWSNTPERIDDSFNLEDELQKIKVPKTKTGDLVILGEHKLICGDSNNPLVLERLFRQEKASMIYSDPIYNLKIDYTKGLGGNQNYGGTVDDDRTEEEYISFLRKNIATALSVTQKNCHVFYWNTEQHIWILQTLYREFNVSNKRVCLWIKNGHNPTPKVAFNKCYEPCVYGTIGSPYLSKKQQNLTEVFNENVSTGNESLININIWTEKRVSKKYYVHATTKPPELHYKAIQRCTQIHDIILDSFGGSGSTLIACEQLKRRSYLVELEPVYCDIIIARYEKLTGNKAVWEHEKV